MFILLCKYIQSKKNMSAISHLVSKIIRVVIWEIKIAFCFVLKKFWKLLPLFLSLSSYSSPFLVALTQHKHCDYALLELNAVLFTSEKTNLGTHSKTLAHHHIFHHCSSIFHWELMINFWNMKIQLKF